MGDMDIGFNSSDPMTVYPNRELLGSKMVRDIDYDYFPGSFG